jgi:hypothetical protein
LAISVSLLISFDMTDRPGAGQAKTISGSRKDRARRARDQARPLRCAHKKRGRREGRPQSLSVL